MPTPFVGEVFTFHDPDGTEITVRGWGNQFAAVFETLDGYTVVKDPASGYYHYATLSADKSELLPSGTRVGEVSTQQLSLPQHLRVSPGAQKARAQAAQDATGVKPRWQTRREQRRRPGAQPGSASDEEEGPSLAATGGYTGLCLLVQFPDVSGTISTQEVNQYCNQQGYANFGNNGSVRDYFHDVSGGRLTYTNVVTSYYTTTHNRDYYTNPSVSYGTRARELIIEALDHLKSQGFNFNQLTADNAGFVRALNVFYAGPRVNNWSEGLWPHAWALASAYVASSTRRFSDYQITNMGGQLALRTFCHENGHMICDFPDLYDYGGESSGVGHYCLMAAGGSGINPTQVCAYLKNQAGWADTVRNVTPGMAASVSATTNDFLIHQKNATEYFIIENRQQTGRDTALPDAGVAIWHVDENGSNNNEQMTPAQHYECSLEQADGHFDLEHRANSGDGTDLFGAPSHRQFGNATTPNSRWWDGTSSGLEIIDVSASGSSMTVTTQAAWQNDRTVLRTHAKSGSKQAWVFLQGESIWHSVDAGSADGTTNLLMTLSEGLANNRKVDVLIRDGRVVEATLK